MDKERKYVILWETLNHTLVFLVSAQSEEEALRNFAAHEDTHLLYEGSNLTVVDQFDGSLSKTYSGIRDLIEGEYSSVDARFEICRTDSHSNDGVIDLFCSKDQIYGIDPAKLNHFLEIRHLQIASTYFAHDRYSEAEIEFTQALSLNPLRFMALSGLAQCQFKLREFEQSVKIYNDVIIASWATETEIANAHRELGAIFRASGDPEAAERHEQIYFTWENS